MSNYPDMIKFEEGFRSLAYYCSEGYPTIGHGFKLGPKYAPLKNYTFEMPEEVSCFWLKKYTEGLLDEFDKRPELRGALAACMLADKIDDPDQWFLSPRASVLLSMAHQMGIDGLAGFKQTLKYVAQAAWSNASANMLRSMWHDQTPNRAKRHAEQMRTGEWAKEYTA